MSFSESIHDTSYISLRDCERSHTRPLVSMSATPELDRARLERPQFISFYRRIPGTCSVLKPLVSFCSPFELKSKIMTAVRDLWRPLRFQRKLSRTMAASSSPCGPIALIVELRRLECLFRAEATLAEDADLRLALTRTSDDLCLLVEQFSADVTNARAFHG